MQYYYKTEWKHTRKQNLTNPEKQNIIESEILHAKRISEDNIIYMGTNKRNYKEYGFLDFSKLWSLLQKKKLNKQYLINNGIHRTTLYKLVNNENVTAEVICKLCYILDTQPKNIMEYRKPEPDPLQISTEPEEPERIDTLPDDDWQLPFM